MPPTPTARPTIILGVDTHRDAHVAAAVDALGRLLGVRSIPTTAAGSADLLTWAGRLGTITTAGVEGTGSYGAALMHVLTRAGIPVVDVTRPDRSRRRRQGKSDPTDAEHAARAVRSGEAAVIPKCQDGAVEALRVLTVARDRPAHGGHAAHHGRRQSGTAAQRTRARRALRRQPDRRVLGARRATPPQPRRESAGEPRTLDHCPCPRAS